MLQAILPTIEKTNDGLRISSESIAVGSGIQHKNVLSMVDKHRQSLELFGPIAFETRKGQELAHGGYAKGTRIALLNEPQSTLLMAFQRNTEKVVAFKVALVEAFFRMARILQSSQPVQEPVIDSAQHGFQMGRPIHQLPESVRSIPYNPTTARQLEIARLVKLADRRWVPIQIVGYDAPKYAELARAIRTGRRKAFPRGEFTAAVRGGVLYIRAEKVTTRQ